MICILTGNHSASLFPVRKCIGPVSYTHLDVYKRQKKAQMNLENCRYVSLRQTSATLDSTQESCCRWITDGEELKNS